MPTTIVIESVAFNQTARCGSVNLYCKSLVVKVSNWTLIQGGPHVTKRVIRVQFFSRYPYNDLGVNLYQTPAWYVSCMAYR